MTYHNEQVEELEDLVEHYERCCDDLAQDAPAADENISRELGEVINQAETFAEEQVGQIQALATEVAERDRLISTLRGGD